MSSYFLQNPVLLPPKGVDKRHKIIVVLTGSNIGSLFTLSCLITGTNMSRIGALFMKFILLLDRKQTHKRLSHPNFLFQAGADAAIKHFYKYFVFSGAFVLGKKK